MRPGLGQGTASGRRSFKGPFPGLLPVDFLDFLVDGTEMGPEDGDKEDDEKDAASQDCKDSDKYSHRRQRSALIG